MFFLYIFVPREVQVSCVPTLMEYEEKFTLNYHKIHNDISRAVM